MTASFSLRVSFWRYQVATAFTMTSSRFETVSMTTRVSGATFMISRKASTPLCARPWTSPSFSHFRPRATMQVTVVSALAPSVPR